MDFLMQAVDSCPTAFLVINKDGVIIESNKATATLFGYEKEELINLEVESLLPQKLASIHKKHVNRFFASPESRMMGDGRVLEGIKKSGAKVYVEIGINFFNKNEDIFGVANIIDVTEEHKMRRLIESTQRVAKIGSWHVDLKTNKLLWSKMTYEIHELDESTEVTVEGGINFYAKEHRPIISKLIEKSISEKESWDTELQILTTSGKRKWVRAIGNVVVEEDEVIALEGVFQDINDRKLIEIEREELILEQKRINSELESSKLLQDLILKTNPDLLFVKDSEFRIVLANQAFLSVYPEDQRSKVIGTTTLEGYNEKEAQEFLKKDKEAFKTGKSKVYEKITFPDGETRTLFTQKIRFYDVEGKSYILGVARNVSKQLQEEELLENIYRVASNLDLTIEEKVTRVLASGNEYLGLNSAFVAKENSSHFKVKYLHSLIDESQELTSVEEKICIETFKQGDIYALNNTEQGAYIGLKIVVEKKDYGVLSFISSQVRKADFTEKEKSLVRLLAQWIGFELTRYNSEEELKVTNKKLKRSNDELSQFAYRTSHDLKAPLTTIKGLSQFMKEDLESGDLNEVNENIDKIINQSIRLEVLVTDILNLARADVEESAWEEVNLNELVCSVVNNNSSYLKDQKVRYELIISKDLNFKSIKSRLERILENLIINAAKYCSIDDTDRFVKIKAAKGTHVEILVEDNGLGIPVDKHDEVFKMFSRFHPDKAQGSGLGMSIVHKNVTALGGKISFTSSASGSTFKIEMPLGGDL